MSELRSCCGFRCDLCPAYRENVTGPEHQRRIAEGWRTLYDIKGVGPDDVYCDGCRDMRPEARRVDVRCKVRPCVLGRGLAHCGQCPDYPCATMKHLPQTRGQVEQWTGRALSDQEYRLFVHPYESTPFLAAERTRKGSSPNS
ncbi:MAG: DUF3795 domain-containing protein [Phycisphaerae bacterium]|nr:DUF3795 domain-containing protein [Phycisphaerae bacterium]